MALDGRLVKGTDRHTRSTLDQTVNENAVCKSRLTASDHTKFSANQSSLTVIYKDFPINKPKVPVAFRLGMRDLNAKDHEDSRRIPRWNTECHE